MCIFDRKESFFLNDYQNNYPVVLIHGLMGWGENDGITKTKLMPYWGKGLVPHLESLGYEVYAPSLGPFASAWDRSCELWAYLFGGTVDYGKAHSEKHHHKRYGRTYETGAIEDLGKTDAHRKIQLLGHSFGGPTVKMFAELMSNGSEEERNATNEETLSPLFKGGHGEMLHTVTTLTGVNNGTTLANIVEPKYDPIVRGILIGTLLMENTPVEKMFDFGNQQFGLGEYPENIHSLGINPPKETVEGIKAYSENRMDNIAYEMTVELCQKMNEAQGVNPHIYYFAQRTCATTPTGGTPEKPTGVRPNKHMGHICFGPGEAMCHIKPKNMTAVQWDESWWPNDGFVNVVGQSAPLNQPAQDGKFGMDFQPGVWYNMPVVAGDHVFWNGMSGHKKDYYAIFEQMLDTYRRLPDA